ncbi:MAG: hypothetical protein M3N08_10850, partial [Pseudomonadota bacterium]|nr:hypothetical protein [Pseudomonadota bacterium]
MKFKGYLAVAGVILAASSAALAATSGEQSPPVPVVASPATSGAPLPTGDSPDPQRLILAKELVDALGAVDQYKNLLAFTAHTAEASLTKDNPTHADDVKQL